VEKKKKSAILFFKLLLDNGFEVSKIEVDEGG
jgi:hypothetical protein